MIIWQGFKDCKYGIETVRFGCEKWIILWFGPFGIYF